MSVFSLTLAWVLLPVAAGEPVNRWHETLADAKAHAAREGCLVFVRFEAAYCGWCQKLEEELADESLQDELGRWSLASLDTEKFPDEALALAVSAVPALRLLSADGRLLASQDGYMEAAELGRWLAESRTKAIGQVAGDLAGTGEPNVLQVARLMEVLGDREALTREAAIRRLLPYPAAAARSAVEQLAEGTLQTRLAVFELLQSWQAPVASLDPWQPGSITDAGIAQLREWAVTKVAAKDATATAGGSLDLNDLDRLVRADDAEANVIRERLARGGDAVKLAVVARLKDASTDKERERLLSLRYRLAASDALALRWPSGITRLSALSTPVRQEAARELAEKATREDEGLLLELFSDPDPLVRETSLRALRSISGQGVSQALILLLDDPDPNVRAAVLKQLSEEPVPAMAKSLADYVIVEEDPDLVVHAVRAMSKLTDKTTMDTLRELLKSEHWRVRAEAVDALGKPETRRKYGGAMPTPEVIADLAARLTDPDSFVAGRAAVSIMTCDASQLDMTIADALLTFAARQPDQAADIIEWLAASTDPPKLIPRLEPFLKSDNDKTRGAAVSALSRMDPDKAPNILEGAIADPSEVVALAAIRGILSLLAEARLEEKPEELRAVSKTLIFEVGLGGYWPDPLRKKIGTSIAKKRLARYKKRRETQWIFPLKPALEKRMTAESTEVRILAGHVLVQLGERGSLLDQLVEMAAKDPSHVRDVAIILKDLEWPERKALFARLLPHAQGSTDYVALLQGLAGDRDGRALRFVWSAMDAPHFDGKPYSEIVSLLDEIYFEGSPYARTALDPAARKQALAKAKTETEGSSERRRMLGWILWSALDFQGAKGKLLTMIDEENLSEATRHQFLVIYLDHATSKEGEKLAGSTLDSPLPAVRRTSLAYLVEGYQSLDATDKGGVKLSYGAFGHNPTYDTSNFPVHSLPKGISIDKVRPLAADTDPMTAARAGYLLVLGGDQTGIEPLLVAWQNGEGADDSLAVLLCRVIAVVDSESYVPILERIYALKREDKSSAQTLYWTIRDMKAPGAVKLRKRMRGDGVLGATMRVF